MTDYAIIRNNKRKAHKDTDNKADEIFRRVYHKLRWTTPCRVLRAKEISLFVAYELKEHMTSTGWIVITRSEKKLAAVGRWWNDVIESLDSIEKIKILK